MMQGNFELDPMILVSLRFVNTWGKTKETFFKWGKII